MYNSEYSKIDPKTGNVNYKGPLQIMKGNHHNMPSRTEVYLPGDERGHVNASSLGGINTRANVVAQNSDVNHGGYLSVENGERNALLRGAAIYSEKTAIVNGQTGERPTTFIVNDTITYTDRHIETVCCSFLNESYAQQDEWNKISAELPGTFDELNPGDDLREAMGAAQYADLMTETDEVLPNLDEEYVSADFSSIAIDSVTEINNSISSSDQLESVFLDSNEISSNLEGGIDDNADVELEEE